jgi:ABC-type amino acid transport substrate-binding protein
MARLAFLVRSAVSCLSIGWFELATDASAQTLDAIKQRGTLICGASQGVLGFSNRSQQGEWSGLDVDVCRALAAAIFNDASMVQFEARYLDHRELASTIHSRIFESSQVYPLV